MEPSTRLLAKLLNGNIIVKNIVIPIQVSFNQSKTKVPCITLDNSGGQSLIHDPYYTNLHYTNEDGEVVNHELYIRKYHANNRIHIWVHEKDGESIKFMDDIYTNVIRVLTEQVNQYYKYCLNYEDGDCKYLGKECEVHTYPNNFLSVKKRCPDPKPNHYHNWFDELNVKRTSLTWTMGYDANIYKTNPPLLHKIIGVECVYNVITDNDGTTINNVKYLANASID